MDIYNLKKYKDVFLAPKNVGDFKNWLNIEDVIPFLKDDSQDDYILVSSSGTRGFIHSIIVKNEILSGCTIEEMLNWSGNSYTGWGMSQSSDGIFIDGPNYALRGVEQGSAEQVVFSRFFDGPKSGFFGLSLNQKIEQSLGLYFLPERDAWCVIDDLGDYLDVVKVIDLSDEFDGGDGRLVCFKRSYLDEFCCAYGGSLFRMFDFTRFRSENFHGYGDITRSRKLENKDFSANYGRGSTQFGFLKGYQIIRPMLDQDALIMKLSGESEETKNFCEYIAYDYKNSVIKEISCAPSCLANYFTESSLPFETTPAFFKPEVLQKYKSNSDKYKLENRSVTCHGAWSLTTFDVNEQGQVHTYLKYLSYLPYQEQLHWKQFNEAPKAAISKRAFKTDFMGEFVDDHDPILVLKARIRKLNKLKVSWWSERQESAFDKVHYPYTNSPDEWADELMNLDQLVVEGFREKPLKSIVKELSGSVDNRWRGLKLVEQCLVGLGFDEEHAYNLLTPFQVLHDLRSKVKGHSGSQSGNIKKEILKEYKTYGNHFRTLLTNIDDSLRIIIEEFIKIDLK